MGWVRRITPNPPDKSERRHDCDTDKLARLEAQDGFFRDPSQMAE